MFRSERTFGGWVLLVAASWLLLAGAPCSRAQAPQQAPGDAQWNLTWSDEFNGPDGSMPDPKKWSFVLGGSGFGNNESEYYTDRAENIHQEKGHLVVTARKDAYVDHDGVSHTYTSARIQTKGLFEQKYGRMEASIKIPAGQGLWPAFWMLGNNIDDAPWPECGEVDIMENVGFEPSIVHGTLHGPNYSGSHPLTGSFTLPENARFSDDFHLFAVEWDPQEIRFYVDAHLYETRKADTLSATQRWVFDHPFFLLLNLAVGGYWPGSPNDKTVFPATMLVDYVRVYSRKQPAGQAVPR